jgi:3-deoxy-manno-octulosonate cytidylyltransferase (CMP-KDO synthetase)
MKIIAVIPARYGSRRFPGKPLVKILGKTILQHVYERVKESEVLSDTLIATDDSRIAREAERFGGKFIFTSPNNLTGTDRVAEVSEKLVDTQIFVNIQCDQPLFDSSMIEEVVEPLLKEEGVLVSTLKKKISHPEDLTDPSVVKVVTTKDGFALYFSRHCIPYTIHPELTHSFYKHIGIYGYKREFLLKFPSLPSSSLERAEELEQLRILESGYRIRVIETNFDSYKVDTPEDLKKVKEIMGEGR